MYTDLQHGEWSFTILLPSQKYWQYLSAVATKIESSFFWITGGLRVIFCFCCSCIQAVPSVNASAKNAACIFYNQTVNDGLCKNMTTGLYVFGDNDTLERGELQTKRLQKLIAIYGLKISTKCKPIVLDLFCRNHFPPCDTSLAKPRARGICRKTCEYMDQDLCKKEMIWVRKAIGVGPVLDKNMINCSLYDIARGGDSPECYQYYTLPGVFILCRMHVLALIAWRWMLM